MVGYTVTDCKAHKGVVRWHQNARRAYHGRLERREYNLPHGPPVDGDRAVAEQLRQSHSDRCWDRYSGVGHIDGGVSANTVPDECGIEIDRRPLAAPNCACRPRRVLAWPRASIFRSRPSRRGYSWPALNSQSAKISIWVGTSDTIPAAKSTVPYGTDASTSPGGINTGVRSTTLLSHATSGRGSTKCPRPGAAPIHDFRVAVRTI